MSDSSNSGAAHDDTTIGEDKDATCKIAGYEAADGNVGQQKSLASTGDGPLHRQVDAG
eukprot:CAMPEP_0172566344 /NCGR_PEP_ID=MMETSP1067-20121228/111531_1 /TAXON_ID=265564 ORGANISM="Thalassiosira punctigera, Strain Tpunct2005C2" /NCGR_SAMPLE_ID=MMETSP1067 /ASSEMBLY_ACC=CAM_ASM_000444 /LENGTH=57 /DNA_ID=CAMNT_0013357431 /DNA_START=140 /DNA_END=309 /DNA_ORIENTATION=-